jgi:hypothetical protein
MSFFPNLIVKPLFADYSDNTIFITQLVTIGVYNTIFTKIRTNIAGMGPVRPGSDLSTICSREDDDMNNAGNVEAAEDGERPEARQAAQRGGSSLAPSLQGGVATSMPRWRRVARSTRASSSARSHCRPGHDVSV